MRSLVALAAFCAFCAAAGVAGAGLHGQAAVTVQEVTAAIDRLGAFEFKERMTAARTVRRAPGPTAVPALLQAIDQHPDGFVRFRALVLLSGFNDPRIRDAMERALADPNDRLRTIAYGWFEHERDPGVLPKLLAALPREESEFVRPALTRALAAYGDDARVREPLTKLVESGQVFFRSTVIEALGDYRAAYALPAIVDVAKQEGGLQQVAALALGRIGDKRALEALVALQRSAPRDAQPAVAAGICLLGVNCGAHQGYLTEMLRFGVAHPGHQELVRGAARGLAALAVAGSDEAAATLIRLGAPTRDPERAAVALALGTVALRGTPVMLRVLEAEADPEPGVELLREAFDMLEEDFEEERFFVTVRRRYWQAAEGSRTRQIADLLVQRLEF